MRIRSNSHEVSVVRYFVHESKLCWALFSPECSNLGSRACAIQAPRKTYHHRSLACTCLHSHQGQQPFRRRRGVADFQCLCRLPVSTELIAQNRRGRSRILFYRVLIKIIAHRAPSSFRLLIIPNITAHCGPHTNSLVGEGTGAGEVGSSKGKRKNSC